MTMLADQVDLVIGVDTHKQHEHRSGRPGRDGRRPRRPDGSDRSEGHEAIFEMAARHDGLRAWAIEGTNSYGAGLTRFLRERGEWVIELDRPEPNSSARREEVRPARRGAVGQGGPCTPRARRAPLDG